MAHPALAYGCGSNNPACGGSSDGGGSSNGVGGPSSPSADIGAGLNSSWAAPLWSGTFRMQTFGGVYRSGVAAQDPNIWFSTTLASDSPWGFHGCVEAKAFDANGGLVWDRQSMKGGVSGWSSTVFTFGVQHLSVTTANSISSFTLNQWQCAA